jgi:hypothetical protein
MGIPTYTFLIVRICAAARPFSSPELCHNQIDPLPSQRGIILGRARARQPTGVDTAQKPPAGPGAMGAAAVLREKDE